MPASAGIIMCSAANEMGNGDFSRKTFVNTSCTLLASGDPADYDTVIRNAVSTPGGIKVSIPARSFVFLMIQKNKRLPV